KTGEKLWERRDLPCNHWRGPAASPVLHGDNLYLLFDGYDYQYAACLDRKTGKTVWKRYRDVDYGTDNGDLKKAFSTPTVINVKGRDELVCAGAVWTQAFDPKTGEEIWRVKHGGMNQAVRPLYEHGLVYANTADGGWNLFALRPGKGELTEESLAWKT